MDDESIKRAWDTFKVEADEILAALEQSLLDLEERQDDPELLGKAFRLLHTLKGSGAMFGLDAVVSFAHEVEAVFDCLRKGETRLCTELLKSALDAVDHLKLLVNAAGQGVVSDADDGRVILDSLKHFIPKAQTGVAGQNGSGQNGSGNCQSEHRQNSKRMYVYRIRFIPHKEIFQRGLDPVIVMDGLCSLGRCYPIAHQISIPQLGEFDPEKNYTWWDILLSTDMGLDAIKDAFSFYEDSCELKVEMVDDGELVFEDDEYMKLGEILVERGDIGNDELQEVIGKRRLLGQMLVEAHMTSSRAVEAALAEQKLVKDLRRQRTEHATASTLRVSSEKLDTLVDLVGEIVTVQGRLAHKANENVSGECTLSPEELAFLSTEMGRLVAQLHGSAMSIRMVPIGSIFGRLRRYAHDLAPSLGKEVDFVTDGAETELDKSVIEGLTDPLMHIIRNCLDHGIEPPHLRAKSGKTRRGSVRLVAAHSGANVNISVIDDGAGIDPEAVRARAIEKGLIQPESALGRQELLMLVCTPAFSMAESVTDVSGRGVGMDVVKKCLENMRGGLSIESESGKGCTITLRIPLTLAIIDGLLVELGPERYVFPLSMVQECIDAGADIAQAGVGLVTLRGSRVPCVRLRKRFGINGGKPETEQVVIVSAGEHPMGFVVDNVIGKHQTVIKSMSRVYRHQECISGATILGDGSVALVLDVQKLYGEVIADEAVRYGLNATA